MCSNVSFCRAYCFQFQLNLSVTIGRRFPFPLFHLLMENVGFLCIFSDMYILNWACRRRH